MLLSAVCAVLCSSPLASAARVVVSGAAWKAVDGSRIQAHAPGIVKDAEDGSFWWFGESEKTNNLTAHGVDCYHSTDLFTWTTVGQVLNQAELRVPGHKGPFTIERPKVLYHRQSGAYVLWSIPHRTLSLRSPPPHRQRLPARPLCCV